MVHKQGSRPRGRPRQYDPRQALQRAQRAFWRVGYSGTSLDQLTDATSMNRPSLYAAFGDKRSLYLRTLDEYVEQARAAIGAALDRKLPLREGLQRFYDAALAAYLPPDDRARGCYLIGTALTEAPGDEEIRTKLSRSLHAFDRALQERLQHARQEGELPASADPKTLAVMASAVLHTLAVRARAGESRPVLQTIVKMALDLICGPALKNTGNRKPLR